MGRHRAPVGTRRALVAAAVFVLSGCGSGDQGTTEGLVVDVVGDLSAVESFSVLDENGTHIYIPSADGDFAFPLPHLREHMISGEAVIVFWQDREGVRYAVKVDDAGS
ncbi:MAG: hypothetical protein OEX04_01575 [Acidimicrobiia bacterium]|nr:hypothetical protein [Acidimicrobiia bacterium]MDH4306144.1 hypothetical protein [Acidimicrobiia bacterium]